MSIPSSEALAEVIRLGWASGAALALIKPEVGEADLLDIIDRYDPSLLVREDGAAGATAVFRSAAAPHPRPVTDGSVTVFTSGTTARPKGVVLPRAAVMGNALKTARVHGFGSGRPHGTCLELFHVNALMMSLLGTHLTGEALTLDFSGSPSAYFSRLEAAGARTASTNPRVLRRLVDEAPPWPKGLEYVITAAGPCGRNLATDFYELYGPRLRQGYGMSEAVNFSFMMPFVQDRPRFASLYLARRPPIGHPVEDTHYMIDGGELLIRTPDLMDGYLQDEHAGSVTGGWLHTGDFAEVRDGMVVLLGRVSEAIDVPGLPRPPGAIEDRLDLAVDAGDHAVVRIPGRPGVAVFTSRPLRTGLLPDITGRPGLPVFLVCADELMLSGSGKVRRSRMSDRAEAILDSVERAIGVPDAVTRRELVPEALLGRGVDSPDAAAGRPLVAGLGCGCHVQRKPSVTTIEYGAGCPDPERHLPETAVDTEWLVLLAAGGRGGPADRRRFHPGSAGDGGHQLHRYARTASGWSAVALRRGR
ncbi:AMP-binding protein [Streptomyces sp. NPDC001568]|uniref:AMP-binding protein n=1 Tax=Streptomyces sp. NPDC001568 TaxID=3364588 RepID=UPI00369BFC4F